MDVERGGGWGQRVHYCKFKKKCMDDSAGENSLLSNSTPPDSFFFCLRSYIGIVYGTPVCCFI